MSTILQINSSLFGENGQSGQLAKQFVEQYQKKHESTEVIVRDLSLNPVPHLTGEVFQGFLLAAEERSEHQKEMVELSDQLVDELKRADVLVIGLPMYNYSLPSTLKAYFDHIARAGITFRYTENGPEGLLKNKKAYILAARGGMYQGTEFDTQSDYIRHFLDFIGITDVEFAYAEGLSMGEEAKDKGLKEASDKIQQLVA